MLEQLYLFILLGSISRSFSIRQLKSSYVIHTDRTVTILYYLNFLFPLVLGGAAQTPNDSGALQNVATATKKLF